MSDTPRPDDEQFRDPTAPIDPSQTQEVPPAPPGPPATPEPSAPPAGAGATPPPPQNPYATSNPYAPQNPYGGQPPAGYGAQPPAGYGPPTYQPAGAYRAPAPLTGSTITLLVLSGLTTIGCGFGIVALIFAIIAAAKKDDQAESAKFTRWGWIALVVGFVLTLLVIGVVIAVGLSVGSSSDVSGY